MPKLQNAEIVEKTRAEHQVAIAALLMKLAASKKPVTPAGVKRKRVTSDAHLSTADIVENERAEIKLRAQRRMKELAALKY